MFQRVLSIKNAPRLRRPLATNKSCAKSEDDNIYLGTRVSYSSFNFVSDNIIIHGVRGVGVAEDRRRRSRIRAAVFNLRHAEHV